MPDNYTLQLRPEARADAVITGDCYRFTVLTESLIRMEYQPEGQFTDGATQTVICRDFPVPSFRIAEGEERLEIITEDLHLFYNKKSFSPEGLSVRLKKSFHVHGSVWRYGDTVEDLKGTARTLDGVNGKTALESGLLSRGGYTVLDDSGTALVADSQWIEPRKHKGIDLYFFGYGHRYMECLRDFYRLSGHTPLLPRFALGNWWSRYHKYTEESYLTLMEAFRTRDIPLSVAVIDMDWHLVDVPPEYGSGWTGYTWNRAFFPDPKRFMDRLHDRGLRVTLNLHPADGVRAYEEAYPAMAEALEADSAHQERIPFEVTDRKFMDAYFKYLHHPHEEKGVDFWWIDWQQGERSAVAGIDPLWMLNHLHFIDSGRGGRMPLTFSRYAGVGSHRYPVGFSGDTVTSWESLAFQPYFTANASNVGYTWWSHDIGGHMLGTRSDELTVRWVQFGVFSPIMRLHSSSSEFYGKEPWNYTMEAEAILSGFLRLRHRLIPYIHTMNYLTAEEGIPLLRPMYYHHDVQEAYGVPNEYYFGTEMIACPITSPVDARTRLAAVHAWLPEGTYYDFFSGNVYRGGRRIAFYRPLDCFPVLVPAGSIIPLAGDCMTSHMANPEILEIRVYHGAEGSFTLTEDDCSGRRSAPVVKTRFTYAQEGEKDVVFRMEVAGENAGLIPADRTYQITIAGVREPETVRGQGAEVQWTYSGQEKALHLTVSGRAARRFEVRVSLADREIAEQDKQRQIFSMLQHAQIEYTLKDKIYDIVTHGRNAADILAALTEMQVEPALYGAVTEILTMNLH